MFGTNKSQLDDSLQCTYNLSLLIAKIRKPLPIGKELFLPAFSEMSSTDLHHAPGPIIKSVLLSDNTVQRRIADMADDTEKSLCEILVTGSSVSS